jgi:MoaA/NifB/PqqE/SkfB family radical SAM enzyme
MTSDVLAQASSTQSRSKVDIIWNVTLVCPWDCQICCVDAVHVTKRQGTITMRSQALSTTEQLPMTGKGNHFEQAMKKRQEQGLELDLAGKLRVIEHLRGERFLPKIDFSGGDVMVAGENFEVMKHASSVFGRDQITLTATGAGLFQYNVEEIAPHIGELNFTYDSPSYDGRQSRPAGYASGNLRKAAQFAKAGVLTRGECPLTVHNIEDEPLRQLYRNLHEAGINKLLLMRLFPVGRGHFQAENVPSPAQYRRAIQVLRDMEAMYGFPTVKLQCALKFFDKQDMQENPCDLVRESFGLQANGTLLTSPWAVGAHSQALHDAWVLGNLSTTPLADLLATEKAQEYYRRQNENFGHCKIFAFLTSRRERPMDRIFDTVDPLAKNALEETLA